MMFQRPGQLIKREFRRRRPKAVSLSSSGKAWPSASTASSMLRNLRMWNGRRRNPVRSCLKRTGRPSAAAMATARPRTNGERRSSAVPCNGKIEKAFSASLVE
jgi:hypothetical protein